MMATPSTTLFALASIQSRLRESSWEEIGVPDGSDGPITTVGAVFALRVA